MINPANLAFFNIVLYILILRSWMPVINGLISHNITVRYTNSGWLLVVLFCVYAGWDSDYEHYYAIFDGLINDPAAILTTHLEIIYVFIIKYCCFENYSIFRLIVWGGAVLLLRSVLKHLGINNSVSIVVFALFNLLYFSYARVSLAISLFLYGYMQLLSVKNKTPIIKKIGVILLGIVYILLSLLFHKSVVFLLMLLPFSFIPLFGKKIFILIIILPLVCYIVDMSIPIFLDGVENDILNVENAVQGYIENPVNASHSLPGIIILILEKYAYFYGIYIVWKNIYGSKRFQMKKGIRSLFNLSCLLLYLSVVFMVCGLGYVLERRILLMSYLPLFCCIAYCFCWNLERKEFMRFSIMSFTFSFLKLCYFCYVYQVR